MEKGPENPYEELKTNEKSYATDLARLTDPARRKKILAAFDMPQKKLPNNMSKRECAKLLDKIHELHQQQEALSKSLESFNPPKWTENLKKLQHVYNEYRVLYEKIGVKPIPAKTSGQMYRLGMPQGLEDILIKPIQQPPRYQLLAKDLLKFEEAKQEKKDVTGIANLKAFIQATKEFNENFNKATPPRPKTPLPAHHLAKQRAQKSSRPTDLHRTKAHRGRPKHK